MKEEGESGELGARGEGSVDGGRVRVRGFFVWSSSSSSSSRLACLCSVWWGAVVGPVEQIPYPKPASICT